MTDILHDIGKPAAILGRGSGMEYAAGSRAFPRLPAWRRRATVRRYF